MADSGREGRKGRKKNFDGTYELSATVIATLLITGAVELNPGPDETSVQVLCNGCDRILKSGTQCVSCGRWYHKSCGNVKIQEWKMDL